ncbi:Serine aminopeptidase, S33 [Mucilaginibacter mallensis]|uniref:Serine aminopeptidase, S33 n=1 Tax=Mucilaginibacter mallensis TaxID=652787 RepID=A0A1H2AWQ1_MUCMA|nr:alpha/beta hydrolase [Mucilaginibacter mallensis]SDT50343.1 Serine aminopeptidase, S33 [Mucilaginibacter mallensis]
MKHKLLSTLLAVLVFAGCSTSKHQAKPIKFDTYINGIITRIDTMTFTDSSRGRDIPIAIYYTAHTSPKKLVILNPGYGGTKTDYGYIAVNLANNGYMVVTIQHDLPGDTPIPTTGNIYELRKPFWDTGVKSIFFVAAKIKAMYPQLDYKYIALIGHSNGGDMAMLIANEYPGFAKIVITLDNRRVPFPRASKPKIFSIRSSDQPADLGVLPSTEEQEKYHIKIVKVNATHNNMGGMDETDAQKTEINSLIINYLNSNN